MTRRNRPHGEAAAPIPANFIVLFFKWYDPTKRILPLWCAKTGGANLLPGLESGSSPMATEDDKPEAAGDGEEEALPNDNAEDPRPLGEREMQYVGCALVHEQATYSDLEPLLRHFLPPGEAKNMPLRYVEQIRIQI